MNVKKFPKYTGKIVVRKPDGKDEVFGYISLWEYVAKEEVSKDAVEAVESHD